MLIISICFVRLRVTLEFAKFVRLWIPYNQDSLVESVSEDTNRAMKTKGDCIRENNTYETLSV